MLRYLARRLLLLVPVILGAALIAFALLLLIPGDPAIALLGQEVSGPELARFRHILGLDRAPPRRCGRGGRRPGGGGPGTGALPPHPGTRPADPGAVRALRLAHRSRRLRSVDHPARAGVAPDPFHAP